MQPPPSFLDQEDRFGRFIASGGGLFLIAVVYYAAVRLGVMLTVQPEGLALIWPASGVALAALILARRRWFAVLAVIFATNALGNLTGGNALAPSLGFAFANTFEPAMGAWVLGRACGPRPDFSTVREIIWLLVVAVLVNGLTALVGAAVPSLAYGSAYFDVWFVWWVEDGLGILLLVPVIVAWARYLSGHLRRWNTHLVVEAALLALLLCGLAWILVGPLNQVEPPLVGRYMVLDC